MIEAIQALQALSAADAAQPAMASASVAAGATANFSDWVGRQLEDLNTQMVQSEVGVQQLASGQATNLHDVMLRLEESRLAFQLAVQVRNRVVEAYQEVLRLQV